ncbi:MAG: helix-turn-helix transcriptional regulator [Lachnospiraceae bacterium]|nr:helix-turn-helix transcriptional regulator [Lachnospiraceae bacterium]
MNQEKVKRLQETADFCGIASRLWGHPLYIYDSSELLASFPEGTAPYAKGILPELPELPSAQIHTLQIGLFFGVLRIGNDLRIIAGPISLYPLQKDRLPLVRHELKCNEWSDEELLSGITGGSYGSLQNLLALLNNHFHGYSSQETFHSLRPQEDALGQIQTAQLSFQEEVPAINYSLDHHMEQLTLAAVRSGDIDRTTELLAPLFQRDLRLIHHSNLHQLKALFICVTTLVTRAAIDGGVGYMRAFTLSDSFIARIETIEDDRIVLNMISEVILTFTSLVREQHMILHHSSDTYVRYVKDHLYNPLSVEDLAREMHISRSQLTRIFQRDLEMSPAAFIMECRLEESIRHLDYTDKSIGEISTLLCFSSESHYITAFKKQYGMTPGAYRERQRV